MILSHENGVRLPVGVRSVRLTAKLPVLQTGDSGVGTRTEHFADMVNWLSRAAHNGEYLGRYEMSVRFDKPRKRCMMVHSGVMEFGTILGS